MLAQAKSYEEACRNFRWRIPERYNLAFDVSDRQTMGGADGYRTALIIEASDGTADRFTFGVLRLLSNRLANVLAAAEIGPGDRVGISLGPSLEAAVALLAVTRMGAIAVPLPTWLGSKPFQDRLRRSGAKAAVTAEVQAGGLAHSRKDLPELGLVLTVGGAPEGTQDFWVEMERASDSFSPRVTAAHDPAFLIFPSHSGDNAPGVVLPHRALLGNLPAVEFALDFFAQTGDAFWGSFDWMTFEGLFWGLLPAWHHGVPVVARQGTFEPDQALKLMGSHGVRAIHAEAKHLALLVEAAASRPKPILRAVAVGPSAMPSFLHAEAQRVFGVVPNALWGVVQTGAVAANNPRLMEYRPGSPGRAVPGVTVEAVDDGREQVLKAGDMGVLAAAPGTPGAMLAYWDEEGALKAPATGWFSTGHVGMRDLDGYLWPEPLAIEDGATVINGLRVVLAEVETCLKSHDAIADAGVVALPGGFLKAFVVLSSGSQADPNRLREFKEWVTTRRGVHEAPDRMEFVQTVPRDQSGMVQRDELINSPLRLDPPSQDDRLSPRF